MYGPNDVEFMGILVDRQYTSGQKYAQLVFETTEGIRLSLSRNINMVRSLRLGLTYRVTGSERAVGQKRYVHEPTATLVAVNKFPLSFVRSKKILIPAVVGLVVVLGGVSALAYATNNTSANSQPTTHKRKSVTKLSSEMTPPVRVPADSQAASDTSSSDSTQQQTQTTATPSTMRSTPIPSTTSMNTPAATNSVTTPMTNDEPVVPSSPEDTTPIPTEPTKQIPEETPPLVEETIPDSVPTP